MCLCRSSASGFSLRISYFSSVCSNLMEGSTAIDQNCSAIKENEEWIFGSGRNCVLRFTCNVLSNPTATMPAVRLHMAFKSMQAETKLLSFLLLSHGFHEVSVTKILQALHYVLPYVQFYSICLRWLWSLILLFHLPFPLPLLIWQTRLTRLDYITFENRDSTRRDTRGLFIE